MEDLYSQTLPDIVGKTKVIVSNSALQKHEKSRIKQLASYLGPAFIVSVAYIDPGNFATNISGGAIFNYSLLWVILASNLMAIFLQTLSAKLGIATGFHLPDVCARNFSKPVNIFLWIIAQMASMATNIAEFLGATLGIYLLFGIPMIFSGLIAAILIFFIVYLNKYGQRVIEAVIAALVFVISIAYGIELFLAKPDWPQVGLHTLVPSLPGSGALLIAAGMLGATVMPHVIFLHSGLVQSRNSGKNDEEKRKHLRMEKIDIVLAMNIAFIINAAMVVVSAAVFFSNGLPVDSIEMAHRSLEPLLGTLSSGVFGIALLASGLSSSVVGTMAGQTMMNGFIKVKIPDNLSRLIVMTPAIGVVLLGINPFDALILSQVSLSFALPAAIIPLLIVTGKKKIMGVLVNKMPTRMLGWLISGVILTLNAALLYLMLTGKG